MAKTKIPGEYLADDSVTLDKMAGLARGKIIYGDASGNPAALVKKLEKKDFNTRADFLADPVKLAKDFDALDKYSLRNNTLFGWLKSLIMPDKFN